MTTSVEQTNWLGQIIGSNIKDIEKHIAAQIYHEFVLHAEELSSSGDDRVIQRLAEKSRSTLNSDDISQLEKEHAAQDSHLLQLEARDNLFRL